MEGQGVAPSSVPAAGSSKMSPVRVPLRLLSLTTLARAM